MVDCFLRKAPKPTKPDANIQIAAGTGTADTVVALKKAPPLVVPGADAIT